MTHLAKQNILVEAHFEDGNYIVRGKVPWASGVDYFDCLLLGFRFGNENCMAILDMKVLKKHLGTNVTKWELDAYQGTNSAMLELTDLHVPVEALVRKYPVDKPCLLYTSPSPRDKRQSRMPSSA